MAANRKSNFLICVGIGKKQKPLVKKAVDAGFEVIGVDKNPYSGCQSLCIHTIKCSTHEPIKVIKELKSYLQEVKPKGVIFFTDGKALLTVALISEEFSLGNLSLKLAKASVEKTVLYEDCKKLGILTPISIKLDSFKYFKEQYFGMVIKPDISTFGTKNATLGLTT